MPTTTSPSANAKILQSGAGRIRGEHYVPALPESMAWGRLPCATTPPSRVVPRGTVVTIDTVSHEGILEDQGRDPLAFFASHGVPADAVLRDAIEVAAAVEHTFDHDGPHVVNRPVAVEGAGPGDVIVIDVISLERRVPYGVISSRHGKGALPGELPEGPGPMSWFCTVDETAAGAFGVLDDGEGHRARFPLQPFLGLVAVAVAGDEPPHSVPPGRHGGNLDIKDLCTGSRLYLPAQVEGGLVSIGDPHFAQGHGEVALTAFEAPLRATLRVDVLPADAVAELEHLAGPFGETEDHWVAIGLDRDLRIAMQHAVRAALATVVEKTGMNRSAAYAYLSAAGDFMVSQVVDGVVGVHCLIAKRDFATGG